MCPLYIGVGWARQSLVRQDDEYIDLNEEDEEGEELMRMRMTLDAQQKNKWAKFNAWLDSRLGELGYPGR